MSLKTGTTNIDWMNLSKSTNETAEDADADNEKLLILPLNDTNSKKISQVISSDTARSILEALASAPHSASEIAQKLGIPLTTVQYNLENLCDAGLVRVARTKYSRKMKPVKLYEPQRKIVVIAPVLTTRKAVIAALKRYVMVIAFALVGSGMIELLAKRMGRLAELAATRSVPEGEGGAPPPLYAPLQTPAPEKVAEGIGGFDFFAHPGLWFLFGCLFVILVVFLIEYLGRKTSLE